MPDLNEKSAPHSDFYKKSMGQHWRIILWSERKGEEVALLLSDLINFVLY